MITVKDRTEILHCPLCTAVMILNEEDTFWGCSGCGAQLWFMENRQAEMSPILVNQLVRQVYQEELRVGFVGAYKKRRSSKSGRKRKKPQPKKRQEWEYA